MLPLDTQGPDSKAKKVSWVQRLTQICRREIWNYESSYSCDKCCNCNDWEKQETRVPPQVGRGHRCTVECALSSVKQTNKKCKHVSLFSYRGVVWLGLEPNSVFITTAEQHHNLASDKIVKRNIFLIFKTPSLALGPTQPSVKWVPGSSRGWSGWDVKLTTCIRLLPRLKMCGAVYLHNHYIPSWRWQDKFNFYLFKWTARSEVYMAVLCWVSGLLKVQLEGCYAEWQGYLTPEFWGNVPPGTPCHLQMREVSSFETSGISNLAVQK